MDYYSPYPQPGFIDMMIQQNMPLSTRGRTQQQLPFNVQVPGGLFGQVGFQMFAAPMLQAHAASQGMVIGGLGNYQNLYDQQRT